ncbi:MAG TPA: hypothetical protein VFJ16_25080 [Longimicrobium sp.]|nr:hypothetical protein [Longimicrobium sp.]
MKTKAAESPRYGREFWAGIAAFAGWCIALAAGMPLLLALQPGWPAARVWMLIGIMATGVVLVFSGELTRRVLPSR